MKKVTCAQLSGPATCDEVITGNTAEEIIDAGWKHMQEAHPEQAQNIMNNPKEANDAWMAEFKAKFDTLETA
jgi:predicted small metal-binding protein